jgi:hypothetical protein
VQDETKTNDLKIVRFALFFPSGPPKCKNAEKSRFGGPPVKNIQKVPF